MQPADPSAFAISIGSYELLEGVGSDAVSEVWLARVVKQPDRVLRLARLKRDAIGDSESREAFLGFMRKAATRRSPLLLRVMAVGAEGDNVYAAVEHVEGVHLGALLSIAHDNGELLPTGVALRVVLDVVAALDALGTSHGDLTPGSIHITAGGVTLLSPVSLAVAACRAPREGALRRLAYKAPEQLADDRNAAGTARADVFALGAILYEMLTGRPLIRGTDGDDIAEGMASALPPDTDELPVPLAKVVKKALGREPGARYSSPDELGQALEKAGPEMLADRHQMAGVFWHLAGNDLAARRFELESLMLGASEIAAEEARRSSEFPPALSPEEAKEAEAERAAVAEAEAEAEHSEQAEAKAEEEAEGAEAEADAGAEAANAEAAEAEAAEAEAVAAEKTEAKQPTKKAEAKQPAKKTEAKQSVKKAGAKQAAKPERKERRPAPKRAAVERDEPPVVRHRSVPPERTQQTRKVVTGVVIGAAALLALGLIVHSSHQTDALTATPDTATTHASPPAEPTPPQAAPVATKPDIPATAAPEPSAAAPEPSAAAPEPPAPAPEPPEDVAAAAPAHPKKKHKTTAAAAPAPAKTAAAPAATASATPPVKHTASFGAFPPATAAPSPKPPPPSPAPKPTVTSTSQAPVPVAPF